MGVFDTSPIVNQSLKPTGGSYLSVPIPSINKDWKALKPTVDCVSLMTGVDPLLLGIMCCIESSLDYMARAKTSSAAGLLQFILSTWKEETHQHGPQYGIPEWSETVDLRCDPRVSLIIGAEYLKGNIKAIAPSLKRDLMHTDLYVAHFLGTGGAKKFFTANPDTLGKDIFPSAAKANVPVFYNKNGEPKKLFEIYNDFNTKLLTKGKVFKIYL